jgi:two-component system, OmpR family, response regulator
VDDNQDICDLIKELLYNFEVRSAADMAGALALAAYLRFDMFVLDIQLPDGDGFELLSTLRERHPDTPAVFITVDADVSRDEAVAAGAFDLIRKSGGCFVESLLATSSSLLEN